MSDSEKAKSTILPLFKDFWNSFEARNYDKAIEHYHPDGVHVEVGKKGVYGKNEAKNTVQPILDEIWQEYDQGNYEKLMEHYHPDAVLIEVGKKGTYGKDDIIKAKKEFSQRIGKAHKSDMKVSNEKFQMTDDYIMYCGESELKTEKKGLIKGKFHQIWRKTNGTWLLLREAWESDDV
ncbi:unnamed protein product [Cylicocyclus nassatus]|uniref:DUF4440 domain-containing protein n=1 Tax=Cylicocyclus nassatus TaxID=53992 RepID=A0AA36H675_CYLNA|nr:unnamed protein product [Cylicocyclus nassatus]